MNFIILTTVVLYFVLLLAIAYYTSRNSNNDSFFNGNKNSNWMLVAFGMIGTSLSGLTFISVPGTVGGYDFGLGRPNGFVYFQVVLGYIIGYLIIAYVLLPLYYKMNLTSIYTYLQRRFGNTAYKTGASFFILSRTVGATARLYLVINVLQMFLLDAMGVPFWVTTFVILLMILLYTFEGGVKTIVYTDTLQTTFMLLGLIVVSGYILSQLNLTVSESFCTLKSHNYFNVFVNDYNHKSFFLKAIFGGIFIAIAMTGLDQEMMQKNISVKTLKDAQKNILTFTSIMVFVNFLFLFLGGLLYLFALSKGAEYNFDLINKKAEFILFDPVLNETKNILGDNIFPTLSLHNFFPITISIIFIIGLISALFPSADGALTALTSSFCVDILGMNDNKKMNDTTKKKTRLGVHLSFSILFFICIMIFKSIGDRSIIDKVLDLAGYTYGPLLGLFAFGILTKRNLKSNWGIVLICILSPIISYYLKNSTLFGEYKIGLELLIINGLITFLGLYMISEKDSSKTL